MRSAFRTARLSFRPPADVLDAIGEKDQPATIVAAVNKTAGAEAHQVWRYQGGRFTPVVVEGGLADDRWTELVKGGLQPGDRLVTSAAVDTTLNHTPCD